MNNETVKPVQAGHPAASTGEVKRWHPALVIIHWTVALFIFVNFLLGAVFFRVAYSPALVGLHVALGTAVLLIMLARLVIRWATPHPPEASTGSKLLDTAANLVHYGLYLLVILLTVAGILYAAQSAGRIEPLNIIGVPIYMIHMVLAWLVVILALGHAGAALYHEVILKDKLISRMTIKKE
jgi:cytochrome b561